ncbi:serine/threonine protein kinase [Candidatus Obscuribacterales bacterium]|nr:serine/threonine protein kinase [Candidatus Obscuribacterales bacterium]
MPNAHDPLVGTTLDGRYLIEELIGSSSLSNVYRATQLRVNRDVAVKTLKFHIDDKQAHRDRFQNEVDLLCALSHPNIVTLFDWVPGPDGQPCVIMDYLPGRNLEKLLAEDGPLNISRFTRIFVQVLGALEHAHRKGVIHRDVKPGNIVLMDKETDFIKVVDFGLAKLNQSSSTDGEEICGSPPYMSPEQCMGKPGSERSDIYSIGVVMYEMITGKDPFHQATSMYELIQCHVKKQPPPLKEANGLLSYPVGLEPLLLKAMAKDPADRHQSANELKEHLVATCLKAADNESGLSSTLKLDNETTKLTNQPQTGLSSPGGIGSGKLALGSGPGVTAGVANLAEGVSTSTTGDTNTTSGITLPSASSASTSASIRQNAHRMAKNPFMGNIPITLVFALLIVIGLIFGSIQFLTSLKQNKNKAVQTSESTDSSLSKTK